MELWQNYGRKFILFTFVLIYTPGENITFLIIRNSIPVLVITVKLISRQVSRCWAELEKRFLRNLESIFTYATPLSSLTDLLMYSIISNLFLNCSVWDLMSSNAMLMMAIIMFIKIMLTTTERIKKCFFYEVCEDFRTLV